jgi:hypothetical protein
LAVRVALPNRTLSAFLEIAALILVILHIIMGCYALPAMQTGSLSWWQGLAGMNALRG